MRDPNPIGTGPTKSRADHCTTHHHACDCREWEHACRIEQLEAALEAAREDACVALVADIRFACGDNGKRMQPELVEFIRGLAEDAGRYQWLRDDAVHYSTDDGTPHPWVVFGTGSGDCVPHWEHDLDTAIDQARGKGVADEA